MAALSSTATPATRNALETSVICPVCVYNGVCAEAELVSINGGGGCEAQSDRRMMKKREMSFLPFGILPGWHNFISA